jgi:type I restriction enzyme, S subunit
MSRFPLVRIGDVAVQVRGVSYDKSEARATASPGYVPILRANNITDFGLNFEGLVYVPTRRVATKQVLQPGDIVIAASSGSIDVVGKAAPVTDGFSGSFGAFCKVIRPSRKIDPRYLAHYFKTPAYRRRISSLAAGVNINNLRSEHIDELMLPFPPMDEQQRVAAILDKAEELRAKRRAALALLDQLPQAIFLEVFGDPATNPKGWPVVRIGDLLESANYGTSGKAGTVGRWPVLRMGNLTSDGHLDLGDLKYIDLSTTDVPKYTVRKGDILFNRTNSADLVGKTALYSHDEPVAFAGYLVRLRVNDRAVPVFIAAFMNLGYTKRVLRGMAKSIVGMANINAKEVQTIALPLPPLELQRRFAARVEAVERAKAEHESALAELDSLFASLQASAFAGDQT